MKKAVIIVIILILLLILVTKNFMSDNFNYPNILKEVAEDVAGFKSNFPQLNDFSVAHNLDSENLIIDYSYHTHQAEGGVGWVAGVPNPDQDGIWLQINFYDEDSTSQINTQASTIPLCLGAKRVKFLILEGEKTNPVSGQIRAILENHGVKSCN